MKKISNDEILIKGKWLTEKMGAIIKDEESLRIEWLIHHHLKWIYKDDSGWLNLYQDPDDGRYWELIYENSEFHGGGAPSLKHISNIIAKEKYKFNPNI